MGCELMCKFFHCRFFHPLYPYQCQSSEGGIIELFPFRQLFIVKFKYIMIFCSQDSVMFRIETLDYYPALFIPSAGPSRHLRDQLKCPLRRTKIRKAK